MRLSFKVGRALSGLSTLFLGCFLVTTVGLAAAEETPAQPGDLSTTTLSIEPDRARIRISAAPADIRVLDGDTFWLGVFKVRLIGIDTLEAGQDCTRKDGTTFECAENARRFLEQLLAQETVVCDVDFDSGGLPRMDHNRYLAACRVGATDVSQAMLREGWAVLTLSEADSYANAHGQAIEAGRGLHAFRFEKPSDFRRRRRMDYQFRKLQRDCEGLIGQKCDVVRMSKPKQ